VTREVHRILVIADDENDLTLIQELLEQSRPNLSNRVDGCCSLRDAEKLLTNGTHDLLVISEKTHGMPGAEILASLRG
jgi:DNA-binding response OmpR family regulator